MTIIRPGDPSRLLETKYFMCKKCGAIWAANKDEYLCYEQYNEEYFYCECPTEHCTSDGYEIPYIEVQPLIEAMNKVKTAHNDNYWENR